MRSRRSSLLRTECIANREYGMASDMDCYIRSYLWSLEWRSQKYSRGLLQLYLMQDSQESILLEQCDVVATRMRRKGKKCTCISVTFRTLDFKNRSHQMKLGSATDVTDEVYANARKLFAEFWKGQPLRLIGVALTGLTEDGFEQMSLFEDCTKKEQRQKLDAAMDAIRMKFGNDKITRASIMNSNAGIGRKAKAQMENEENGKGF